MKYEYGRTTLHPWGRGMNNIAPERGLPDGTVRSAVNVDFVGADDIRTRGGMVKVYSAISPKGGFSCPVGAFFIENGNIMKLEAYSALVSGADQLTYGSDILISGE